MSAITVAVVGARDIAAQLGKKGTTSDVTMFNAVGGGHAITLVEPTQYPEKLPPLLYALAMADRALFVVETLSKEVAETATALDLVDIPVQLHHGPNVGPDELRRAFKGMRFAADPIVPLDLLKVRDELDGWATEPHAGPTRVPIDHAFPVKGVGAVALGVVRGGPLHAHDKLRLYPTTHEVEIRSIQVHDVDVHEAATGDRVGVAIKGVDADQLERGQVLAPAGALSVTESVPGTAFRKCPYYRAPVDAKSHLHLAIGLEVVPVVVESFSSQALHLTSDRPVAFAPGEVGLLADLDVPSGPRMVGRFVLGRPTQP